jgi:hypothetical protein
VRRTRSDDRARPVDGRREPVDIVEVRDGDLGAAPGQLGGARRPRITHRRPDAVPAGEQELRDRPADAPGGSRDEGRCHLIYLLGVS